MATGTTAAVTRTSRPAAAAPAAPAPQMQPPEEAKDGDDGGLAGTIIVQTVQKHNRRGQEADKVQVAKSCDAFLFGLQLWELVLCRAVLKKSFFFAIQLFVLNLSIFYLSSFFGAFSILRCWHLWWWASGLSRQAPDVGARRCSRHPGRGGRLQFPAATPEWSRRSCRREQRHGCWTGTGTEEYQSAGGVAKRVQCLGGNLEWNEVLSAYWYRLNILYMYLSMWSNLHQIISRNQGAMSFGNAIECPFT